MKHASSQALDKLEALLAQLRRFAELKERRRGVFYRNGKAHLHFHEDPTGLFADLREGADWRRFDVSQNGGRKALLDALRQQGRQP
jgi:hypothetical protein